MRRVVAISINKVQTFLYYAIQSHMQEHQSNSGTLKSVMESSEEISSVLYQKIGVVGDNGCFSDCIDHKDILLKCSGTCIFATDLGEEAIAEKCKQLFRYYYEKFQGQMQIRYTSFLADLKTEKDKVDAIQKGKKHLKGRDCQSKIIEENQDVLFQFQECRNKEKVHKIEVDNLHFVKNINELKPENIKEESFRIAVIKADIDGMGNLLNEIQEFDNYKGISDILTKWISLDKLSKEVCKRKASFPDFKLFPLYVAGDDILFAVPVKHIKTGIVICTEILKKVNSDIKKILAIKNESKSLSISIGIEIIYNREPIRYYYERVQERLEKAKSAEIPKELENVSYTKIAINKSVFYKYEWGILNNKMKNKLNLKKQYLQWDHFMNGIKILHMAENAGFKAHHYLYGLLQKMTCQEIRENEIKRSNAILYHLLPQHLNSSNKILMQSELLFIKKLLEQVTVKKQGRWYLDFEQKQYDKLEQYIRLLLLFTDERFERDKNQDDTQNIKFELGHGKRIHSVIFNRSLYYLYHNNLDKLLVCPSWDKEQIRKLKGIFIEEASYFVKDDKGKGDKKVQVYRTLPISTSMFYKMKSMEDTESVANLIDAMEYRSEKDYDEAIKNNSEEEKAPPNLYFHRHREEFLEIVNNVEIWSNDYVDSLLIFYQFNERLIQYRILHSKRQTKDNVKEGT